MVLQRPRCVPPLGRCALALLVAVAGWVLTVPVVLSAAGTVETGGGQLVLRAGPATRYPADGAVADSTRLTIVCQHPGSAVRGTWGLGDLWDQQSDGGWVADAYVAAGSRGPVAPICPYAHLSPDDPRSIDQAISWKYGYSGSTAYEDWCLRFQARAFGWSYAGFQTAKDQYQWSVAHGNVTASGPPAWGSGLVRKRCRYRYRYRYRPCVVSINTGLVIGTSADGRVDIAPVNSFRPLSGLERALFPDAD